MAKQLLVRVNENEAMPTDVIAKIVREFGKSWGAAYVEDEVLNTASDSDAFDAEMVEALQTPLLENNFVFFASDEKADQPYAMFEVVEEVEVLDDNDQPTGKKENVNVPIISLFMEGNFKVRLPDKTEHTHHATVAASIKKKIGKWMQLYEDDVEKVMAEIRENEGDFLNLIVDKGTLLFVADNGDVCNIAKTTTAFAFPWGWMSDGLGFQKSAAKTVKDNVVDVTSKVASAFRRNHKGPTVPVASTEPISPAPAPVKTETAVPPTAGTPNTEVADAATGEKGMWWRPTKGMSRNERKSKYKTFGAQLTGMDWKNNTPVFVPMEQYDKINHDKFGGEWLTQEQMTKELANQFPGSHPKKEEKPAAAPAPAPAPAPAEGEDNGDGEDEEDVTSDKGVTAEILPILSSKAIKAIVDGEVLKTLDTHSLEAPTADDIRTMEKKYPGLMKMINRPVDAWMKWKYEGMRDLNAAHPDALPILMCDARLELWKAYMKISALESQLTNLKKAGGSAPATSVPATATAKQPEAPKVPEAAHAPAAAENKHSAGKFKNKFKNRTAA